MPSSPNSQAPRLTGQGHTVLLLCAGALLSASAVGAPLAAGGLLRVIAATAAGRPAESTRLDGMGETYRRGLLAILCASAWLLPGPVVFGVLAVATSFAAGDPAQGGIGVAALAASAAYLLLASIFAEAATVEFAVRGRLAAAFDVGALRSRVVGGRGFWQAWAAATASVAFGVTAAVGITLAAGWPVAAVAALGLAAAFLAGVPAAFTLGAFARGAYGLLACVPVGDGDQPPQAPARC